MIQRDTLTLFPVKAAKLNVNREYGLQFVGRLKAIRRYASRIKAAPVTEGGTGMLQISLNDELPSRAKKIIGVLIFQYNVSNLEYKNQAIRRALTFLNNRLVAVSSELGDQENQVSNFKARNKIYDVSATAGQLLQNLSVLDEQISENDYRERLLTLVETNIKSFSNREEIVPNAASIQDPVLAAMVNKYNELVLQKRIILDEGTPKDVRLPVINGQLEELRKNILKNINNIRKEYNTQLNFLTSKERAFSNRFEDLPQREKEYIEIMRLLAIKEALYTFLLQKREETEIQLVSSDVTKSRTVDEPINRGKVEPKGSIAYLLALSIGLLLPSGVVPSASKRRPRRSSWLRVSSR